MPLKELLTDAAKSHDIIKKLSSDQEAVMDTYSLTAAERDALRKGDKDEITALIGGNESLAAAVTVISIIVVTDVLTS